MQQTTNNIYSRSQKNGGLIKPLRVSLSPPFPLNISIPLFLPYLESLAYILNEQQCGLIKYAC